MIDIRQSDENGEQFIDVIEYVIQRPINYNIQKEDIQKKKKHIIKAQIIASEKDKNIVSVCFDKSSVYDFNIFKNTTGELLRALCFLVDSGYQGILN